MRSSDRSSISVSTRLLRRPAIADLVWVPLFLIGFGIVAARLGTDGTPDFKIYHFYNGFAAHHSRIGLDIFPAQLQTTFFPGLDYFYYSLFTALNNHPALLNAVLSVPYALAALAIFWTARLLVEPGFFGRDIVCFIAAVLGLTGASGLPTLATTMSDVVPGVPLMIALAIWLTLEKAERNSIRSSGLVGLLGGLSVGLKLTQAPLFVGLFAAISLRRLGGTRSAISDAIVFGGAGVGVFAAVDAAWLVGNYRNYGNPVFPLMNEVFRSDLVAHSPWTDLRFMPKTPLMALFYPAYWGLWRSHDAIELNMRDPRMLLGCLSALAILVILAVRFLRNPARTPLTPVGRIALPLAILFLTSYAIWEKLWSIYRYLAMQEALSGVLVLAMLVLLAETRGRSVLVAGAFAAIAATATFATEYPWWSRAQPGPQAISVHLPPIEKDAIVLFLDPYAYSYLTPFLPETARAIGMNSNLVRPDSPGTLEPMIAATIRDHKGPFWGMEYPEAFPGIADASLDHHKLTRDGDCSLLDTNIEDRRLVRICRLRRQ